MRRRAPASAAALRPLLFVLVSLFLVLPTLVYNFVTLDAAQIARWTDPSALRGAFQRLHDGVDDAQAIAPLAPTLRQCVVANRTDVNSKETAMSMKTRCFSSQDTDKVQDIVHFVYLPVQMVPLLKGETKPQAENFTMAQFAAFQSIRRHANPSLMVLHYPATEPRSFWYTQCQRYLALHRVSYPKLPVGKTSSLTVYQRRDVIQLVLALRALRKQGGVAFTDFNTILLHSTSPLRQIPFFAGRTRRTSVSISPTMISAGMGNGVVAFLESKLLTMLETDYVRLRDTPLDVLLGELIVEKDSSVKPGSAKMPNVLIASPAVIDSVPDFRFGSIVKSTKLESAMSLRDSLVFRMPNSQSSYSAGYTALGEYDKQVHDLETLADDASAFSAILRFATSRNQTNELDFILL